MKLGIGAIPQNLIIKSGGYTYYPLNQFEIDGTVAVELYRQDSEGEKRKIFIFKGEKDELKKFKVRFPVIKDVQTFRGEYNRTKRAFNTYKKDVSPSVLLFALAENLSAEAAAFNKKIKTGARLTPNEQIAVKKSGTTMINVLRKLDENKIIDQKLPTNYKVLGKNKFGQMVEISDYPMSKPDAIKFIKDQGIERYYTNVDIIPYRGNIEVKKPAVKKVATKLPAVKKLVIKKPAVKKVATKKPAAVKKPATKKSPLRQTGSSNKKYDERFNAMKPGKRKSASGNIYYERRADHSDKGKKL